MALRERQAEAAFNLIADFAASDPDAAVRWYGDIKTLAAKYPKEEALCEQQAKAALNLIGRLAASDPDADARWYGDIKALAAKYPKEETLSELQTMAATNLLVAYAESSDKAGVKQMEDDIRRLAEENPGIPLCQEAAGQLAVIPEWEEET